MKVSVVIPAWGGLVHLEEMRGSVSGQTFTDFEVIECAPPEGRENAGAARNAGLGRAKGEWIYFADADDRLKPELLAKALAAGEGKAADVVVFAAEEFDDVTGWRTPLPLRLEGNGDDVRFVSYGNCVWNKLFRAEYLQRTGIRFQEQKRSNDLAFVVEALARTDRIAVVDEALYEYRINNAKSLQASKFTDATDYAAAAFAECVRRLTACGLTGRFGGALRRLESDIASNNRRGFLPRIIASIRNRGLLCFVKHIIGRLARLVRSIVSR